MSFDCEFSAPVGVGSETSPPVAILLPQVCVPTSAESVFVPSSVSDRDHSGGQGLVLTRIKPF